MRYSRVWIIPRMLLTLLVLALSASACALPLPSPRESHVAATQEAATVEPVASITDTPTVVPTNTPVILVLPTHTVPPSPTASRAVAPVPSTSTAAAPTRIMQITLASPTAARSATKRRPTLTGVHATSSPTPTAVPTSSPTPTRTRRATSAGTSSEPRALPTATATVGGRPQPTRATIPSKLEDGNVILNGDFEAGFDEHGIAKQWQGFDNVTGTFGWSDETWQGLLADGKHAQMMRIRFTTDPDQYIGIRQTIPVIKGETYDLTIHGLIRSNEGNAEASNWGYRIQWGLDPKGRDSWEVVDKWYDTGWDDQPLDAQNFAIYEHKATITPPEDTLTLFIRGWRKWAIRDREVEFVIDGVSLLGPLPQEEMPPNLPTTGAPGYTWTLTAVASLILVAIILVLRQVRNRYATNR